MTQPRRWFQIHLSTAIVLMFVAALLSFLNFAIGSSTRVVGGFVNGVASGPGFPWMFTRHFQDDSFQYDVLHIVLDVIFAITVLIAVALYAESKIRGAYCDRFPTESVDNAGKPQT